MRGESRLREQAKVLEIIANKTETEYADFKRDFYSSLTNSDIIKDIAAFANSLINQDKYIIFGVDDDSREVVGIDPATIFSVDDINNYIERKIEPFVNVSIRTIDYEGKTIAYIKISESNKNPPYVIKEDCGKQNKVEKGDIYMRKGTCNLKATRMDIDNMYRNNGELSISAFEDFVCIEPITINGSIFNGYTCGHIDVEINNTTNRPFLLTNGEVEIFNNFHHIQRQIFSLLPFDRIEENPAEILPNTRKKYTALFDFTSGDCVDFCFDENGNMDGTVTFKIILQDTDGNNYYAEPIQAILKAKGDILHKVKRIRGIKETRHRKRTSII